MAKIRAAMIDTYEPEWVKKLPLDGAPKTITPLVAGDVWLVAEDNKILAIERKNPNDFLNTLAENRLFFQGWKMQELRDQGYWTYLVITGELSCSPDGKVVTDRLTNWNWHAVQGALLSMQELGVYVIFCNGDLDFGACLLRLAERDRNDEMRVQAARKANLMDPQGTVLCSLPGIGPEKVDQILKYAGSAGQAIAELTNERSKLKIPGIGAGMKNNVRWALGLGADELLVVLDQETYTAIGG